MTAETRGANAGVPGRRLWRGFVACYITAIVGPTLILVYLGGVAVQRQREAIVNLSEANHGLQEATLATALEDRLAALSEACLRDLERVVLKFPMEGVAWDSPLAARVARGSLEDAVRKHPIAKTAFLIENGTIRIPRTELALPLNPDTQFADSSPRGLLNTFMQAERLEREHDLPGALATYRRVYEAAQRPASKALALARMARCHEKLGKPSSAADIYRLLIQTYSDEYDLAGRPHALAAAVELKRLTSADGAADRNVFDRLRVALQEGHWELDPESADYFADALEARQPMSGRQAGTYLQSLALGRALRDGQTPRADGSASVVQSASLRSADGDQQIYFLHTTRPQPFASVVGLVVDLNYVGSSLLPRLLEASSLPAGSARLVQTGGKGTSFKNALAGYALSLEPLPEAAGSSRTDVIIFGGAVGLVLIVLLMGVVLLLRDVGRDAAMSQLRADLVGGVSHELKTPLTVIRMYGETLAADPDAPRDERRGFYDVIVQEAERLTRLINSVLSFSEIDRRSRSYFLVRTPLLPIVETVVAQYRAFLDQQGFTLEVDIDRGGTTEVEADREAVSQAIVNLIDNAVKYSSEERWIAIRLWADGGEARIVVADRGPGIPSDERELIFARFYRGAGHAGRGGYGLGLYLVDQLMRAHRGRVEVESEPGRGARFSLVFPVAGPHTVQNTHAKHPGR